MPVAAAPAAPAGLSATHALAPTVFEPHTPVTAAEAAVLDHARHLLADADAVFAAGDPAEGMARLVPGLRRVRDGLSAAAWDAFAREVCLTHAAAARVREDPFVHRAWAKPRGYAGDAGVLDLIYGEVPVPAETSAFGRALYACNVHSAACRSVRERRQILARAIDAAALGAPGGARVLSLACGHLREAQTSAAVRGGAVAEFHALDQDPCAVALLRREHARLGVRPAVASVRDVLRGHVRHEGLHLAYAAGLYDYLPAPVAARLTRRLFEMLAPGGRLVVANFCPELADAGVMEGVMDWRLLYRDDAEVAALAAELPAGEVAAQRVWRDAVGCVAYLEVERQ